MLNKINPKPPLSGGQVSGRVKSGQVRKGNVSGTNTFLYDYASTAMIRVKKYLNILEYFGIFKSYVRSSRRRRVTQRLNIGLSVLL